MWETIQMGYHKAYLHITSKPTPNPLFQNKLPTDRQFKTTKRGRGKLTKTAFFFLDNACPHAAHNTEYLIEQFWWDFFDHLPYFPNLAPRDLSVHAVRTTSRLTAVQKKRLRGSEAVGWYDASLKKLLPR